MPKTWVWTTLGDIFEVNYGKGLVKRKRIQNGEFDVYGSGGVVGRHNSAITSSPTIIIGRKGSVGEVSLSDDKCWPIDTTYYIDYFPFGLPAKFWFCQLKFLSLSQHDTSTAIPGLSRNDLYQVGISLPPLPEQHRIAAKIEELFEESHIAGEALARIPITLRKLRHSILTEAFRGQLVDQNSTDEPAEKLLKRVRLERHKKWEEDLKKRGKDPRKHKYKEPKPMDTKGLSDLADGWAWTTIGHLETFIGSGITPRGGRKVYVPDGIPFIRSQNVHSEGLRLDDVAHVTPEMHEEMGRTHIRPGDVLLNITGASIGRCTFAPESLDSANVNQHVCIIRTGWWILPRYLSDFINSPFGQDQVLATESGVTRQGLNYTHVRTLKVPLAPIDEQHRIVVRIEELLSYVDKIEKDVEIGKRQANKIDDAILAKAFRGELLPQNPDDEPASVLLERMRREREGGKERLKRFRKQRKKDEVARSV
ncbi:MAG: restriction endonuclease subunit S [Thermoplasmata archaeon]|nr:restriction endonuclease subunit S [Thermoplasmata archaeon]